MPSVVNIAASDFTAFVRVMPHSEYPSGSSCICKACQEVTDRYTTQRFGDNLTELRWGFGGIDLGCTSESVMDNSNAAGLGCFHEGGFDIADMKTLANERSQSRLWSGMHFSASVPTDEELCQGLGSLGLDLMNLLRNNSTLGRSTHGSRIATCLFYLFRRSNTGTDLGEHCISQRSDQHRNNHNHDGSDAYAKLRGWTTSRLFPIDLFINNH